MKKMKIVVVGIGMGEPGKAACLEWHAALANARPWMVGQGHAACTEVSPWTAASTSNCEGVPCE